MCSTAETLLNSKAGNSQIECPLFNILPGKIRSKIFVLALIQCEDHKAAFSMGSFWCRPWFAKPHKNSSALLCTCKLAYQEGKKIFLKEIEWPFWFDRGPPSRSGSDACTTFFRNLSAKDVQDLEKVRFFTQMYWLENGHNLNAIFRESNFRPTCLTITIRYSDWWFWETNKPLQMSEKWLCNFEGSPGLRELRVEYETLSEKKEEMMKIVERNKKWKLALAGGAKGYLSAEGTELTEWKWKGPGKMAEIDWANDRVIELADYIVVIDTWRHIEGPIKTIEYKFQDSDRDSDCSFSDDDFFGLQNS
ncbi:hypothetical protein BKA66DRAFT_521632 [Pyrenochaeta sp. MPI-SDFR-AT-0127]|nr:hypothetical protein BKA66DRAFT_521632 [Pyrenochaeta sp. MPI-SDFR-AT-0127]